MVIPFLLVPSFWSDGFTTDQRLRNLFHASGLNGRALSHRRVFKAYSLPAVWSEDIPPIFSINRLVVALVGLFQSSQFTHTIAQIFYWLRCGRVFNQRNTMECFMISWRWPFICGGSNSMSGISTRGFGDLITFWGHKCWIAEVP